MSEAGYTLATGNKRKLCIVDEQGKIHSLSRQLSGLRPDGMKGVAWGEAIGKKLEDVDDLKFANIIAGERAKEWEKQQQYDKQQAEIDRQNKELNAADEAAKKQVAEEQAQEKKALEGKRKRPSVSPSASPPPKTEEPTPYIDIEPAYKKYDRDKAWTDSVDSKRSKLKEHLTKTYERDKKARQILALEKQIAANDNIWGRMSGKLDKLQEEVEAKKLTLANTDRE